MAASEPSVEFHIPLHTLGTWHCHKSCRSTASRNLGAKSVMTSAPERKGPICQTCIISADQRTSYSRLGATVCSRETFKIAVCGNEEGNGVGGGGGELLKRECFMY